MKSEPLLNLEVTPARVLKEALTIGDSVPLAEEDLHLIGTKVVGSKVPQLKRLRAIHHTAARLLATGARPAEVSLATGLAIGTIYTLNQDPSFKELQVFYEDAQAEAFFDFQKRMETVALDAAAEVHDRLLETPDEIQTKELVEIIKAASDRAGHAPVKKSESVSTVLSKDDILEIKNATARRGQIYEKEIPSQSGGAPVGAGSTGASPTSSKAAARGEGKGTLV